ncbi:periplasmic binding protein-like I [Geranomyces variabilis]|nr:periplasmic binding protein-like I [Geranomyces variabilis]
MRSIGGVGSLAGGAGRICALVLLLCLPAAQCFTPLNFTAILPLSFPPLANIAGGYQKALNLWVDQINTNVYHGQGLQVNVDIVDSTMVSPVAIAAVDAAAAFGSLGILGELASGFSTFVGSAATPYKLMQCSGTSTAASLTSKQYRYFFRTVPADNNQGVVLNQILVAYNWTRIALFYQNTPYGEGIVNTFLSNVSTSQVEVVGKVEYDEAAPDFETALAALKATTARIILWVGTPEEFVLFVPTARKKGLFGPEYVWVATDNIYVVDSVQAAIASGALTTADLQALNGFLISQPLEAQGPNYASFLQAYSSTYNALPMVPFTLFWIDCLDLADLLGTVKGNFTGMTGMVDFDDNFDRIGTYQLLNVFNGAITSVGMMTGSSSYAINFDPAKNTTFYSGTSNPPTSAIVFVPEWYSYNDGAAIAIMILAAILMTASLASAVAIYPLSPQFLIIMAIAMELSYASIFTQMGEQTQAKCMVRPWLWGVAFATIMSCLVTKTYRIWKAFGNKRLAGPMGARQIMPLFLSFFLIILATWTGFSPLKPVVVADTISGTYHHVCVSDKGDHGFVGSIIAYNGALLLMATFLAVRTRNTLQTVYSILLWCTVIIALSYIPGSSFALVFFITCLGVLLVTATTWALLVARAILVQIADQRGAGKDEFVLNKGGGANAGGSGKGNSRRPTVPSVKRSAVNSENSDGTVTIVGLIGEFPVLFSSTFLPSRWESFKVIMTTVPVARLTLRSLAAVGESSTSKLKAFATDLSLLRVYRTPTGAFSGPEFFELDFQGQRAVVQAADGV